MQLCDGSPYASLIPQHVAETCAVSRQRRPPLYTNPVFEEGGRQESDEGTFTFPILTICIYPLVTLLLLLLLLVLLLFSSHYPHLLTVRFVFAASLFVCCSLFYEKDFSQIAWCARTVHLKSSLTSLG